MNRAGTWRRIWVGVAAAVVMAVLAGGPAALGQAKVKVHKGRITVSAPDENGQVHIEGRTGAIESTSAVRVSVTNLATKEKRTINVQADGSFKTTIAAKPSEQVRVIANNEQKKRSYGTFTVVGGKAIGEGTAGGQAASTSPGFSTGPAAGTKVAGAKGLLSADEDELPVGVFLNVVDMRTGQLLASQRMDGVLKRKEPEMSYAEQVKELVGRCVAMIQLELAKAFLGDDGSVKPLWRKEKGETGTKAGSDRKF